MNNVTSYLGFLTVSLMTALSAEPSWAYTISNTLGHGKKCGKGQQAIRWATGTVFLGFGAQLASADR